MGHLIILVVVFLMSTAPASAQPFHTCTRPDGRTVLTNEPCPGAARKPISPQSPLEEQVQKKIEEVEKQRNTETKYAPSHTSRVDTEKRTTGSGMACLTSWWLKEMVQASVDKDTRAQDYLVAQKRCFQPKAGLPVTVLHPRLWSKFDTVQVRLYAPDGNAVVVWMEGYGLVEVSK